MKKKHIILVTTSILLTSVIFGCVFFFSRIGYSSPENLMWLHPHVHCYKIYSYLESNDRVLVLYKGNSGYKKEIIYKSKDLYYLFDYDTKPILWEYSSNGLIIVRLVEGKYTIEISGIAGKPKINNISDSLNSNFEYQMIKDGDYYNQQWFVTVNEIPDNYYINIENEKILVNP